MAKMVKRFERLMPFKIKDVLLVSSSYDHYVLAEDGLLTELMTDEFAQLNLSHAPRIIHANNAEEALDLMQKWRFDLIITMIRVGNMSAQDFGKNAKEILPETEVILLAHNTRELASINTSEYIDRIFVWSGNSQLMVAIIKLVEDERNLAHDIRIGNIPVLLLVEDSRRFFSSYLPKLYREILTQTRSGIGEGLSLKQTMMRLRGRTKVLHATNMEDAIAYVESYGLNLIGLITDAGFPAMNRKDMQAGLSLIKRVRERFPNLPILMQSTEKDNREPAIALGAEFLHKFNPNLLSELHNYLQYKLGFGDFIFRLPDKTEIGRASTIEELVIKLREMPSESVKFHALNNNFSHWLHTRGEFDLADEIRPLTLNDFNNPNEIQEFLANTIENHLVKSQRSSVSNYIGKLDLRRRFQRYGSGSLGGKGRGLAFFSMQLEDMDFGVNIPNVKIDVPQTVVLGTDIFDKFVDENNLQGLTSKEITDLEVSNKFLSGEFDKNIRNELKSLALQLNQPLAIRSSSRLEDALHQPFAGVYNTYFLANDHPDESIRFEQLINSIKLVYASTYSESAKSFIRATQHSIEEESMAVVIQPLIGRKHENRFYPTLAGVARSFNYYPVGSMEPNEGIAAAGLGLGKTVAGGEKCVRFSPYRPKRVYQFADIESTLKSAQRQFWALKMEKSPEMPTINPEYNLLKLDLEFAEKDKEISEIASTWDPQNNRIWDGIGRKGPRLITLSGYLKRNSFPLCEILQQILQKCEEMLACPVEIEFALIDNGDVKEFNLLQLRPLVSESTEVEVEFDESMLSNALAHSSVSLGNGVVDEIKDIIYVDPKKLDRQKSVEIANSISRINASMIKENRTYLLIGPGRWGSSDNLLGIPVKWSQISGARTIIECELADISVDPSQGTHFFQNIVSFNVGYLTIRNSEPGTIDWDWLEKQKCIFEDGPIKHVRINKPLKVLLDGRNGRAAVLKPKK
tara:strand:- start:6736 stop:9648 length:2913 start_codon:yes stop_codon:yes gene_type:complete